MNQHTPPYCGNEKYAFISFCHKDEKTVYPVINALAGSGIRLWYDDGIEPGEDWPERIADKLNGCAACLAFVSSASLLSHNCRKEINYALLKKKPLLIIMLEDVKLTPGMEMQFSTVQSYLNYKPGADCKADLPGIPMLSVCRESASDKAAPMTVQNEKEANASPETGSNNFPLTAKAVPDEKNAEAERLRSYPGNVSTAHLTAYNKGRTPAPKAKKHRKKALAALICAAVLALTAATAIILTNIPQQIAAVGEKTVVFENMKLTADDIRSGVSLSAETIIFRNCLFKDGAVEIFNKLKLNGVKKLAFENLKLFNFSAVDLSRFENLEELTVNAGYINSHTFSSTGRMNCIKKLSLTNTDSSAIIYMPDLSPFSGISSLYLEGSFEQLENISCCKDLNDLTLINVLVPANGHRESAEEKNSKLRRLLSDMKLTELTINDTFLDSDALGDVLADIESLEKLDLSRCGLNSVNAVTGCKRLKKLSLNGNALEDLNGIEWLVHLEEFSANDNALTSISGLKNCSLLKKIDLKNNNISDGAEILSKSAASLEYADLSGNKRFFGSEINVSSWKALRVLIIDKTGCSSPAAVLKLGNPELRILSCENSPISEITSDVSLNDIYYVNISGSGVSDGSCLACFENADVIIAQNCIFSSLSGITLGAKKFAVSGTPLTSLPSFREKGEIIVFDYNDGLAIPSELPRFEKTYIYNVPAEKVLEYEEYFPPESLVYSAGEIEQAISEMKTDRPA